MSCNILDLFSKRHSFYNINNQINLSNKEIENINKMIVEKKQLLEQQEDKEEPVIIEENVKFVKNIC